MKSELEIEKWRQLDTGVVDISPKLSILSQVVLTLTLFG